MTKRIFMKKEEITIPRIVAETAATGVDSLNANPQIILQNCEGDGDCVESCPNDVIEIREITNEEKNKLSWKALFKSFVHGHKKAFIINPNNCISCGECFTHCRHRAIVMKRRVKAHTDAA